MTKFFETKAIKTESIPAIEEPKKGATERVNIRAALSVRETLDYTLPSFLHRTAGVIVAPGSTGKSFLSLQIAMTIALGRDLFSIFNGEEIKAGRVVILNAEDPREVIHQRIHAYRDFFTDADIERLEENLEILPIGGQNFGILEKGEMGRLLMTEDFRNMTKRIKEIAPRLVVLDTLNRMSGGIDENDNAAAGQLINALEWMCREADCSALIVHHTNKSATLSGQGGEQQAARGASALTDNARWQLNLSGVNKDEAKKHGLTDEERRLWVRVEFAKVNYGPARASKWLYRGPGGVLDGSKGDPFGDDIPDAPRPPRGPSGGVRLPKFGSERLT